MTRFAALVGVLSWILMTASMEVCVAQGWPNWANYGFRRPDYLLQTRETKRPPSVHERLRKRGAADRGDDVRDGGLVRGSRQRRRQSSPSPTISLRVRL